MRKVTIYCDIQKVKNAAQELNRAADSSPIAAVNNAVGYLSTWSIDSYPLCDIYNDGNHADMIAVYRLDNDGMGKYVIGAIFNAEKGTYSFHS